VQEKYIDCFLFLSLICVGLSNESIFLIRNLFNRGYLSSWYKSQMYLLAEDAPVHVSWAQNKHLLHLYYSSLGRPISPHTIQLSLTVFLSRFHVCAAFLLDMLFFNTSSTALIALTSESMNKKKITLYLHNFWKLHKNYIFQNKAKTGSLEVCLV
jgi:hypothetical protein